MRARCPLRGIMLRSTGPGMMTGQICALALFTLVTTGIAVQRFSKRLD
jgi:hypothetical protein